MIFVMSNNNSELVQRLIEEEYLKTERIIGAFLNVDRKDFVPEEYKSESYGDYPLPIGWGQTISQPATVAFMLELLQPQAGDKVMDAGSGSGWQTVILTSIVGEKGSVYAVERIPELYEFGQKNLQKYKFQNISFSCGDATKGLVEQAPFDKIIAAASGSEIPPAWLEQLKISGRIVAPIGSSIWLYIKKSETEFEKLEYPGFAFVPLVKK